MDVFYTNFTASSALTKRYALNDEGQVIKTPAATMTSGRAVRCAIDFATFGDCVNQAGPKVAFCYGLHDTDAYGDPVKIATAEKAKPDKKVLARTREYFDYREHPGILMVDHDPQEGGQTFRPAELRWLLADISPVFVDAACWVRGSVSAGVHKAGEAVKPRKGFHLYFAVQDASDIPRFGKVLFQRLWLAGFGFIALSAAGSCLVRGPIDAAVFDGERLDFVGEPVLGDGLELSKPKPEYIAGDWLDTRSLPDLNVEEQARFDALVDQAKANHADTAKAKRAAWGKDKVKEMTARGVPEKQAKAQVSRLSNKGGHDLYGYYLLEFNLQGLATVGDVLANPARYEGQALADPIEGTDYGRTTAKFYFNDGKPVIHSHAHGGQRFFLHSEAEPPKRAAQQTEPPDWGDVPVFDEDGEPVHIDNTPTPPPAACAQANDPWRWLALRVLKKDMPVDCRENVYLYLKHHPEFSGVVAADDFAKRIVMRKPAPWVNAVGFDERVWDTSDSMQLGMWLVQKEKVLIKNKGTLEDGINWAASERRYNPCHDYLAGLQWDDKPRLDTWLHEFMGTEDNTYNQLAGRMFLIGMVARIYRPGCVLRTMPIFEGLQYRGKSTALRTLGGKWFSDTPLDFNNKDMYQNIQGIWLYEIPELEGFSKADVTRMKAIISSVSDYFRAPYDAKPKDNPRTVVFAGTTNQTEYFKDPSGNTRYWPIAVEIDGSIDIHGLESARDQLFAEAVAAYGNGERYWPSADEQQTLFEPEQADREISDPLQELIAKYLNSICSSRVTMANIMEEGLKITPDKIASNRAMATAVGIAVRRLGWIKTRTMDNGQRSHHYNRPNSVSFDNDGW
jgi:hypothetical protein